MSADVGTRRAFDGPHDTSVVGQPPTGLISLSVVAAHHGRPVDPQQLARALALDFARPISESQLLLAAKELGLSAKSVFTHWDRLPRVTFPAIAANEESRSAASNPNADYVYKVHVRTEQLQFVVDGSPRRIQSGMTVQGDVVTDRRRVIDFFLSPVVKYLDEGLKVR